jgi:AcrR family transcriptional regulator
MSATVGKTAQTKRAPRETFGARLDGYILRRGEFHNRILDAAEKLVVESRGTSFSMRDLADRAKVSPATPFNHFGSKRGLLTAIVERSFDQFVRMPKETSSGADPLRQMFERANSLLCYYAEKPDLYRPVFAELLGSEESPHRALLQAITSWRSGLRAASRAGQLRRGRNLDVIANQLETNWIGCLMLWIGGAIDRTGWKLEAEYGTAMTLLSVASDAAAPWLHDHVLTLEAQLARVVPRAH